MPREIADVRHQFDRPFVTDTSATQRTFGLAATPWPEVVSATAGGTLAVV